jgi:acetyl-CoA carboxylase biotin carboxyl carrier protein
MPEPRKSANETLIRAVWDEARDLIKRLEGSTVQRFSVEAGEEAAGAPELDGRHPIKAPLVGTFYRASQPGAAPFVNEGDTVDEGQVVAIVEAMKLMNQVQADKAGKVAEILAEDGAWVEFEQVLMYLAEDEE